MTQPSKPCAVPLCPHLRATGSYVCAAHGKASSRAVGAKSAHKYGAIATEVDGIRFDSKAEATYYRELKLREKGRDISELRLQTRWPLHVNGVEIGAYVSDFDFKEDGRLMVVDVKGVKTPLYRWKKKHFQLQYGMSITEVDKQTASK